MTIATKATRGSAAASKVIEFPLRSPAPETQRVDEIRAHLLRLASRHEEEQAIAFAMAFIQADGSLRLSAKGVDPDIATQLHKGLETLSVAVRDHAHHATSPRRHLRLSGIAITAIPLSIATYLNDYAWLDVALMLLGQVIAARLGSSLRPRLKSRTR